MIHLAANHVSPASSPPLAPRQYGSRQLYFALLGERAGRSHAMHFLCTVAPTK